MSKLDENHDPILIKSVQLKLNSGWDILFIHKVN